MGSLERRFRSKEKRCIIGSAKLTAMLFPYSRTGGPLLYAAIGPGTEIDAINSTLSSLGCTRCSVPTSTAHELARCVSILIRAADSSVSQALPCLVSFPAWKPHTAYHPPHVAGSRLLWCTGFNVLHGPPTTHFGMINRVHQRTSPLSDLTP